MCIHNVHVKIKLFKKITHNALGVKLADLKILKRKRNKKKY